MAKTKSKGSGCAFAGAGCGLFMLVVVIGIAALGYFGYRVLKEPYSGLKQLTEIALIENEVVNQTNYLPPSDGLLSLEQVESLVYIQTEIRNSVGPEFTDLLQKQKDLLTKLDQINDFSKIRQLLVVSKDLVGPLYRAKKAQIAAINREGISVSEYRWICGEAMASFGIPLRKFDINSLLSSSEAEQESDQSDSEKSPVVSNPQNRQLLMPHATLLSETLIFSAIGV